MELTNSRKIWAKPIRQGQYETIYDEFKIISKNSISNKWTYAIKVSIQGSSRVYYGFARSAHRAAFWKPKELKTTDIYKHEVHAIDRENDFYLEKIKLEEGQEKPDLHTWFNPSSHLPKIGMKIIVRRYNSEDGLWEEESAWSGRIFLCDLYGNSEVLQWRKRSSFD